METEAVPASITSPAEIVLATRMRDALKEAVASGMSVEEAISIVVSISSQIAHANGGENLVHQVAAHFMESQWHEAILN